MLEHAQRRPSESTARALILAYQIPEEYATEVWAVAIPNVGRDSPYRSGWRHGDPGPYPW